MPNFPGGDWAVAINDGWYRNVAPERGPQRRDHRRPAAALTAPPLADEERGTPIGLLLVAAPGPPRHLAGHLADRLGDRPHALAARRRRELRHSRSATYAFFFSDGYSLANLTVTLWTTGVRGAPPRRLPAARALPALRDRPAAGLCPGPRHLPDVRALDHPRLRLHPRPRPERHGRPPPQRRRACRRSAPPT